MSSDSPEKAIAPEIVDALAKEGYTLIEQIGDGKTRAVYKVRYQDQGGVDQLRVAKIPKTDAPEDSLCTLRNIATWQTNTREVGVSNKINHGNISRTIQSIPTDEGIVNIEDFHEGMIDLEAVVTANGPLSVARFAQVFEPLVGALVYLNHDRGIVHRDIKPSNVLVPIDAGKPMITDLENARALADVEHKHLPTRGGTPYISPDILFAWAGGKESSATHRTDVYALAATMHFALTRRLPFAYALRGVEDGATVIIDGKQHNVAVFDGDERLIPENIISRHQKLLKSRTKDAPRQFRKLLRKALSQEGYRSTLDFQRDFIEASSSKGSRKLVYSGGLALVAGLFTAIGTPRTQPVQVQPQSQVAPLSTPQQPQAPRLYTPFSVMTPVYSESMLRKAALLPSVADIESCVTTESNRPLSLPWSSGMTYGRELQEWAERLGCEGIDRRLAYSWLLAGSLADGNVICREFGEARRWPTYVPNLLTEYPILGWDGGIHEDVKRYDGGKRYILSLLDQHRTLPELFADYYFNDEEIARAKAQTGTDTYLPSVTRDGRILPGYGLALRQIGPERAKAVDRTLIIYNLSDESGNLDFTRLVAWREDESKENWHHRLIPSSQGSNR